MHSVSSVVRKKIFNSQRGQEALRFRENKKHNYHFLILFSFTSLCANFLKHIEPQRKASYYFLILFSLCIYFSRPSSARLKADCSSYKSLFLSLGISLKYSTNSTSKPAGSIKYTFLRYGFSGPCLSIS